jgi:hypothetical protein
MQISFQFQFQTVLFAHIQLIKNASLCAVGDQRFSFWRVALHGAF